MKLAQRARKNAADQHADHRIAADSAKLYRRQLPDRIDRQGGQNGSDDADIIAFSKNRKPAQADDEQAFACRYFLSGNSRRIYALRLRHSPSPFFFEIAARFSQSVAIVFSAPSSAIPCSSSKAACRRRRNQAAPSSRSVRTGKADRTRSNFDRPRECVSE